MSTCGCQYSSCVVLASVLFILEKNVGLVRYMEEELIPKVSAIFCWILCLTSLQRAEHSRLRVGTALRPHLNSDTSLLFLLCAPSLTVTASSELSIFLRLWLYIPLSQFILPSTIETYYIKKRQNLQFSVGFVSCGPDFMISVSSLFSKKFHAYCSVYELPKIKKYLTCMFLIQSRWLEMSVFVVLSCETSLQSSFK